MSYESGLRERAALFGYDTLGDADTLAMFLDRLGADDARAAAAALLDHFRDLAGVLAASLDALAAAAGAKAAQEVQLFQQLTRRALAAAINARPLISSSNALQDYLRSTLAGATREQFRVLFLDKKNHLLRDELMSEGTVDHAPVYPREVMRRALELGAAALILVHNHPSGDPTPSEADCLMTREIIEAGRYLRVVVHDHIIVGRTGQASFKALGLI